MRLENIRFSEMSDNDWTKLEKKAEKEREDNKKDDDFVAALDLYNEMIQKIYQGLQYKNVTELLRYNFIDVYDISCLTHVPLKEIKCIQLFLEKAR